MQDRRNFIKLGAGGLIGLFAGCKTETESSPGETSSVLLSNRSEQTWSEIQDEFVIREGLTYLNNGTLGLSPTPVSQAIKDRMDVVNATGTHSGVEAGLKTALANYLNVTKDELAL
ncbi:MAG: hypothetical protein JJ975_12480, partial [Bacteroidia bacterium]|nr:hypothetical protein [Bacteroidia bacterium]